MIENEDCWGFFGVARIKQAIWIHYFGLFLTFWGETMNQLILRTVSRFMDEINHELLANRPHVLSQHVWSFIDFLWTLAGVTTSSTAQHWHLILHIQQTRSNISVHLQVWLCARDTSQASVEVVTHCILCGFVQRVVQLLLRQKAVCYICKQCWWVSQGWDKTAKLWPMTPKHHLKGH